ncbi:SRPBCC family protein [Wenxinia marina]|uniref:Activator of Hsp90 ATPase homologue 1/2-like C-terminal domain-containing protein n=1 Tax=Wenxinia marina DSM 24838 TaxID=1123501 RepID=A0A0D0PYS4_9RHOB|nr:SRPBCC family protein [Wenxinia marina]KIQ67574.1 hypothetical protein Wenmar_04000 [Wenxinia marina DSM 24838]GGL68339.1 ATPase [Wenxinia marina]
MTAPTLDSPRDTWDIDREIVLTRVYDHPIERVFAAWTEPEAITSWFSPAGFTCETLDCDIREGGLWRFVYNGPDGTRWGNRIFFLSIDPPRRLVMDHGSDTDDDPNRFRVTVTFDAQSNGKTVVSLRQLHPTTAQRDGAIGFGAVEIGNTTMDGLARYLDG